MRQADLEACSDEQLVGLYARGELSAMGVLVARYQKPLFTFLVRMNGDRARAEDLLQEAFLRMIEHAETFEGSARLKTWLYRIARNLCIDEMRRQRHRRHASLDAEQSSEDERTLHDRIAASAPQSDRTAVSHQLSQSMVSAIGRLPDDQREVFLLRQVHALQFKEIAEITAVSENTVKSRMRYALERLQDALAEYRDYAEELR
ncbi:MAG TPA: RNA polymerase sigma factor [Polyangiales bacterium]